MRPLTRNCQALNSQYRAPLRGTAENRPDLRLASKNRSAENAPNVLADLDVTAGFEHARSVVQSFASGRSSSKVRKPSAVAV